MVPHQRLSWLATDYCGLFQPARATGQCTVQNSKPALEGPTFAIMFSTGYKTKRLASLVKPIDARTQLHSMWGHPFLVVSRNKRIYLDLRSGRSMMHTNSTVKRLNLINNQSIHDCIKRNSFPISSNTSTYLLSFQLSNLICIMCHTPYTLGQHNDSCFTKGRRSK